MNGICNYALDGKRIKLKDIFVEWDTKTMHDLEKMPLGQGGARINADGGVVQSVSC
jgi:hypothetical protein